MSTLLLQPGHHYNRILAPKQEPVRVPACILWQGDGSEGLRVLSCTGPRAGGWHLVPGFYDRARPISDAERALQAQVPLTDEAPLILTGVPALAGEEGYSTLERASVRPTLDIHALPGGFVGSGKKTERKASPAYLLPGNRDVDPLLCPLGRPELTVSRRY